jgi:DNA-binding MarR family transcriptional regulator
MKSTSREIINTRHQTVAQYVEKVRRYPRIRSFFWLLRCSDALDKYASMEVGENGDNRTGLAVLQILLDYPEGIPQQAIANQTGRTKQTIVVAIDKLAREGHVIRCPDDRDRRINNIKITQKGLDHLGEVFPHTVKMCNEALSSLSDSEVDELISLIIKLTKNLWEKVES